MLFQTRIGQKSGTLRSVVPRPAFPDSLEMLALLNKMPKNGSGKASDGFSIAQQFFNENATRYLLVLRAMDMFLGKDGQPPAYYFTLPGKGDETAFYIVLLGEKNKELLTAVQLKKSYNALRVPVKPDKTFGTPSLASLLEAAINSQAKREGNWLAQVPR